MNSNIAEIDAARPLDELTATVQALCDEVESSRTKTAVVLRLVGSGERRQWPGDVSVSAVNRWERAVRRLEKLDAITVAVAAESCAGPALDLLLATDFRIGATGLRLVLPVNDGHFWPGMALYRLVRHLGAQRARQIVMWGADIPLGRAVGLGLIDEVGDGIEEALATATALTGRLSNRETALRRQLIAEAVSAEYDEALGLHLAACDRELRRLRAAAAECPVATDAASAAVVADTAPELTGAVA
ncbi:MULTISPECIES: enoyl-CoA-hydratase DpgB [unclassified Streptomyces]|uniref:enoyl-CoA-hydratase DpgB n=1 Tax=unclassified Streptomyces TaxID=2593676 RepID=UPI002E2EC132|nr:MULTISPECIES: enoyl-CoA-hydratase DpgB [unclassified Streptomyces]WUC63584.1 enoyl-CoA hydratase/isomerase family protein [Streptomyces sp. NBC_00539]